MSSNRRFPRPIGVLLLLAFLAPGRAGAGPTTVEELLRQTFSDARRALYNDPSSGPALTALGEVLARGALSGSLLRGAIANPYARPYLSDTLRALRTIDLVPGVENALRRMASARDDAGTRGASFELIAGACLRDRLACLSSMVGGNEVDAVLRDGTIVEAKDRHHNFIGKVAEQLALRCQGRRPAMVLLSQDPDGPQLESLRRAAGGVSNGLQVLVVDRLSLTARPVLTVAPRLPASRQLPRGTTRLQASGPPVPRATTQFGTALRAAPPGGVNPLGPPEFQARRPQERRASTQESAARVRPGW